MEKNQPYKQDKVFDNILETEEFNVYTKIDDLPLDENPMYLEEGINGICTGGSALFNVFGNKRRIVSNDLVVIFPFQLASVTEISSDFSMTFLKVPKSLFMDTISGICIPTLDFFFYMRSHYYYPQNERDVLRIYNYLGMIKDKVMSTDAYRRELIIHLLRYLYLELFNAYEKESMLVNTRKDTRKEELANKFFSLIMKHFKENKDVAFYADKLCITSKYLTMVIKETSGKSAKDWIVEYIILEIKALLKNTSLNIQEIAIKTNFANQSSLGRFFRKHTGMSLSQYRMSNLEQ